MMWRDDDPKAPWNAVTTEAVAEVTLRLRVSVQTPPGTPWEEREDLLRDEALEELETMSGDYECAGIRITKDNDYNY